MRAMKSPGALVAAGALEIDQLGCTVGSTPIASLHQLQALRTVVARATRFASPARPSTAGAFQFTDGIGPKK
jgi:hypothetical protein